MPAACENIGDAVKSVVARVWILFSVCSAVVRGQEGDGCGHTLLGTDSGTLASQNYPGTYPSNTLCKWRLRVPEGRTLQLLFGDFDVESSPGCRNGSLVITDKNGEPRLGPVCGKLDALQNVTLKINEAIITFMSGPHHSGRGFLLSYTTDQYPDLISCLRRGSHFNLQHLSVYCPAGCKNVAGDVWGDSKLGYRDTSVLCKSAVHAGAISDNMGGRVNVTREKSLKLYESTFANGILSKMGSLSEKKLLFSQVKSTGCSGPPETWIPAVTSYSGQQTIMTPTHGWSWSLTRAPAGSTQPIIVAVGVVLGLIMCGSCLLAGVWWKRRKKESEMKYSLPKSCQSFQVKSLPCPQSELISYPLERNVHDALPSPPLNDYAEPTVAALGQKVGSTFRPSTDEGYTTPFILNHYDTPGNLPEYAEPLPPEPEYATPFGDQPPESNLQTLAVMLHSKAHRHPVTAPLPAASARAKSCHTQYDCPSHRMLSNGYCTPALHSSGPRPASVVYAEPKSCDSLLQNHTYEEPL